MCIKPLSSPSTAPAREIRSTLSTRDNSPTRLLSPSPCSSSITLSISAAIGALSPPPISQTCHPFFIFSFAISAKWLAGKCLLAEPSTPGQMINKGFSPASSCRRANRAWRSASWLMSCGRTFSGKALAGSLANESR